MKLEELKKDGFKNKALINQYIDIMCAKYPDREVKGRVGAYDVPEIDGKLTTVYSSHFINRSSSLCFVPNIIFFDILLVNYIDGGQLRADLYRFNMMYLSSRSSEKILPLLVNAHVAGWWTFRKRGVAFTLEFLGESWGKL